MKNVLGTVYILHFSAKYHHALHYVGWSDNLDSRLADHAAGSGAKLVRAISQKGITFVLATSYKGTRADERTLKKRKNTKRYCPICISSLAGCLTI